MKDKAWFFGTYREQFNAVQQPLFEFDQTFDTKLWNAVGKVTYQANQKNKIIGYYQWGQKVQPNRTQGGVTVVRITSPAHTNLQDSGSWVYKGEWNSTLSDKLYLEARYGDFGYAFPLITNSDANYFFYETNTVTGGRASEAAARPRSQAVQPGEHLLPRHRGRQPHLQVRRRAVERAVVGRLRVAPRRRHQHRTALRQRAVGPRDLRPADGHL